METDRECMRASATLASMSSDGTGLLLLEAPALKGKGRVPELLGPFGFLVLGCLALILQFHDEPGPFGLRMGAAR
jgi:hypothetical protein